ncbi:uncharacterized protein LOC106173714 [Lingula anatina]|uniref:Uncharacterized protein LOC106173714 n=1 Tax=Lingula anatina TaxID=7574 RepID=A0A1S3JIZ1_LINAN|nr:uncharacterized protein LOC106173714 [Lingula anatina]|eukprot:XP_013410380.1 uncharacterized protein LOC106173714 [Lingula anatina]
MDDKGGLDCLKLKRGGSLPVLYARGTHYEVGYQVGRVFKSLIQDYVERDGFLQKTLVPYYNTADGNRVFQRYLHASETVYPQYIEELRGIADGAQLDFNQV